MTYVASLGGACCASCARGGPCAQALGAGSVLEAARNLVAGGASKGGVSKGGDLRALVAATLDRLPAGPPSQAAIIKPRADAGGARDLSSKAAGRAALQAQLATLPRPPSRTLLYVGAAAVVGVGIYLATRKRGRRR